ncbi:helix-turn-helix transcriptional regulator [Pseudomonas sp. ABC1]|uniref:helix-turn-helix transcriptional regulator n=1 Tax=Pseudomonas sp. ABC1 TaxID=2748080 RepID=UPI00211A7203|nr:helix-turn-helix transcriptional regulator [Pseudomonas sp. ABC1]
MNSTDAYDELVSLIYEFVLDEGAWPRLLERLALATGRREATLLFWSDHPGQAPRIGTISLCSPELQHDYDRHYSLIDPTQRFMTGRQVGNWYHDTREYGVASMARDPFYQECLRPHGLRSTSSLKLHEHGGAGAYLSLLSALDTAAPSLQQQNLLERLSPHLIQAARMSDSIQRMALGVAQRDLLLRQDRTPLWLVDARGCVEFCNPSAEARMGDVTFPLRMQQGRLIADTLPSLPALLRAACGKTGASQAGWLRLPSGEEELLVTPVKAESHLNLRHQHPLALVALLENRPRLELIGELFQLTPAESRLASLVARSYSPEHCARRLDISINTVRSQLSALFRKTGTERQSELVALITRLG